MSSYFWDTTLATATRAPTLLHDASRARERPGREPTALLDEELREGPGDGGLRRQHGGPEAQLPVAWLLQPPWLFRPRLNLAWGLFFAFLGGLNLYVAFYYGLDLDEDARRAVWVNFKVFGLMGLTLVFVVAQAFYLARHITLDKPGDSASGQSGG